MDDTRNATAQGRQDLDHNLPAPAADWALFLDVDGVLLEIAETPDGVIVPGDLARILADAARALGGAVALVSGRSIDDLDRLAAPLTLPAAGLHGLEMRRIDGGVERVPVDRTMLTPLRGALQQFADDHEGVRLEDKGMALALHYRGAPAQRAAADALVSAQIARHNGRLHVIRGKMVIEIKPPAANKGTAVRTFMAKPPFAGRRPVFVGDDVTDEDGFAAVNDMDGLAIRVGPLPDGLARTAARWQCNGVADLIAWLAALPERLGAGVANVRGMEP